MINKFNELFEVKAHDTLGTAVIKGATKGFIQGTVVSGIGIGIVAISVKLISNRFESTEEDIIEENLDTVLEDDKSLDNIVIQ